MRGKRFLSLLTAGVLAAGLLAGCSGDQAAQQPQGNSGADTGAAATPEAGGQQRIKVVLKTLSSEYWNYVAKGCQQAGKDLGVAVDVLGATSETAYDEQLQIIETTLSSGECDALVVAPLQAETVAQQISAVEMPVVAIDTNVESDKVLSFVGFDNEQMAAMGGKAAAEAAKAAGWENVTAIGIAGVQGDSTSEARMAGYQKGIEEAGGTFLSAETQYADGVSDKAVTSMEAVMQNHPEGVAIVVANNDDMAMGAARAAKSNPAFAKTVFLGCGGNVAALDAILRDEETMTVAVDGYDVGYRGVQAAVDALNGKTLEKFIASPATIVTKDNAEEQKKIVAEKSA